MDYLLSLFLYFSVLFVLFYFLCILCCICQKALGSCADVGLSSFLRINFSEEESASVTVISLKENNDVNYKDYQDCDYIAGREMRSKKLNLIVERKEINFGVSFLRLKKKIESDEEIYHDIEEIKIESAIFFMRLDLMQLELSAERKKREKLMEKSGR